ncbi:hypothetical protein CVT24_011420 [Panaeolus cyanescens]|uniref:Uncharacterized protein n=1 Tax=Panaeolus cyanescens TaxID=181874 RepID=A0A409YGV8_9AGAR|nr:hypothetical protein CVT24_011420 [Panaeolus cyanescens]
MSSVSSKLSIILIPISLGLVLLQAWIRLPLLVTLSSKSHVKKSSNYFAPGSTDPVALLISGSTAHYQLNDSDSDAEWGALVPSGGHVVHIDDDLGRPKAYTVTLFHQLKCLNIIRQEYVQPYPHPPVTQLTQHCLNYLHQSLLCNINTQIESSKNERGTAARSYPTLCKDWTKVYHEAERNQRQYSASLKL